MNSYKASWRYVGLPHDSYDDDDDDAKISSKAFLLCLFLWD